MLTYCADKKGEPQQNYVLMYRHHRYSLSNISPVFCCSLAAFKCLQCTQHNCHHYFPIRIDTIWHKGQRHEQSTKEANTLNFLKANKLSHQLFDITSLNISRLQILSLTRSSETLYCSLAVHVNVSSATTQNVNCEVVIKSTQSQKKLVFT